MVSCCVQLKISAGTHWMTPKKTCHLMGASAKWLADLSEEMAKEHLANPSD